MKKVSFAQSLSLLINHFTDGTSVELISGHFISLHINANGILSQCHLVLLRFATVGTHAGDPFDGTLIKLEGADGQRIL